MGFQKSVQGVVAVDRLQNIERNDPQMPADPMRLGSVRLPTVLARKRHLAEILHASQTQAGPAIGNGVGVADHPYDTIDLLIELRQLSLTQPSRCRE